jgi:hypothetical protein
MWFTFPLASMVRNFRRHEEGPSSRRKIRRKSAPQRRSFVPRLEILEDRTVLSTLTVMSAADDGSRVTLRAAISAASSGDTIVFDPSLDGQTITLTSGELAITKNLNIEGLGADNLAVSGQNMFRVFDIAGGATVIISGLTIENGNGVGPGKGNGGGVVNFGSNLTLEADTITNNSGGLGGGLGTDLAGITVVSNCLFTANHADFGGGGISDDSSATLTVEDTTLSGNDAPFGGGISNFDFSSATLNQVTLSGNRAAGTVTLHGTVTGGSGGGIVNASGANLFVEQSTLSGNTAIMSGGGIDNRSGATATIIDTSITGNSATTGGGIQNEAAEMLPGELIGPPGTVNLKDSSVSGNSAASGGGIYNTGTLNVQDSSLSGNSAASAGGIYNAAGATATVSDSTITSNTATVEGGGIDNFATLFVTDSTICGNTAPAGSGQDLNNHGTASLNDSDVCDIANTGTLMVSDPGDAQVGEAGRLDDASS